MSKDKNKRLSDDEIAIRDLLTAEECSQYDQLQNELKIEQDKVIQYYKSHTVEAAAADIEDSRQRQTAIERQIENLTNAAYSRLTTDQDHQYNFHDDFVEAIFTAADQDEDLSIQWAAAVSDHYLELYPDKVDLYQQQTVTDYTIDSAGKAVPIKRKERLTEYVSRIAAALEKLTLETGREISTAIRAKDIIYPLDKVNSRVWKLLETTPDKQIGIYAGENKNGKHAIVSYSIDFDNLPDNLQVSKKLNAFDKRVYIAIAALFNAGNTTVSLSQIAYAMGYPTTQPPKTLNKILDSVRKMNKAHISIDNLFEIEVFKRYQRFKYDSNLLQVEIVTAVINGKETNAAVHIFREPPLVTYAREHKQITTVPVELLQSPISKTESNMNLEDYIIEQISHIKKGRINNRMLYNTIFDNTGIKEKKQRQRAVEKVKRLLDYYVKVKLIKSYQHDKTGVTIEYDKS